MCLVPMSLFLALLSTDTLPPAHSPAAHSEPSPADAAARNLVGLLHTHEKFDFVANAPIELAWPLFGAQKEKDWAPGWAPRWLWPQEPRDQHGTIFQIAHGDSNAIWLTTYFDRADMNRVQYAYVIPEVVATIITLRLSAQGPATHVVVTYERTALTAAANATVQTMAAQDKVSGPQWGQQINDYLRLRR